MPFVFVEVSGVILVCAVFQTSVLQPCGGMKNFQNAEKYTFVQGMSIFCKARRKALEVSLRACIL